MRRRAAAGAGAHNQHAARPPARAFLGQSATCSPERLLLGACHHHTVVASVRALLCSAGSLIAGLADRWGAHRALLLLCYVAVTLTQVVGETQWSCPGSLEQALQKAPLWAQGLPACLAQHSIRPTARPAVWGALSWVALTSVARLPHVERAFKWACSEGEGPCMHQPWSILRHTCGVPLGTPRGAARCARKPKRPRAAHLTTSA